MPSTTTAHQILNAAARSGLADIPDAFWEVVNCYRAALIRQAFAILRDSGEAEDAVQETFCEVYRHRERLAEVRSLGAWLAAINRASALKRLRTNKRRAARVERKEEAFPSRMMTTGGVRLFEMRETMAKVVEHLPPRLRTVMVLRYAEHLDCEEIARRMNVPPGTARRLVCEAVTQLHERLDLVTRLGGNAAPRTIPLPDQKGGDA